MTAQLLSSKLLADSIHAQLQQKVQQRMHAGLRAPCLAVILIGADPASQLYVTHKRHVCQKIGIQSIDYDLPEETTEASLLQYIDQLNQDTRVDGILIQLPLPPSINTNTVIEKIAPHKDVDGFHPYNLGRLAQSRPNLRPCTPYGIIQLLAHYHLSLHGQHAVVVGASNIVGRPMALELLLAGCTITVCHSQTKNLARHVQQADVLVSATGRRNLIQSKWLKPGAIVVDVGIHRLANGKVCGDIDFATAVTRAGWITPVPGGVGPMTVATLMTNTLQAAENAA